MARCNRSCRMTSYDILYIYMVYVSIYIYTYTCTLVIVNPPMGFVNVTVPAFKTKMLVTLDHLLQGSISTHCKPKQGFLGCHLPGHYKHFGSFVPY